MFKFSGSTATLHRRAMEDSHWADAMAATTIGMGQAGGAFNIARKH